MTINLPSSAVTILTGDNRLEIQERVASARQEIDPTGLSTSIFDPASDQLSEITAAVSSPGFFGADRLVVCYDLFAQKSRKRSRTAPSDEPVSALASIAQGVLVLVIERALGRQEEQRLRKAVSDVSVEVIDVPRGRSLIDWTCARARLHESTIDGAVATRLLDALFSSHWRQKSNRDDVPPDLYRLDGELGKLATAAGQGGEISVELVTELVSSADSLDIWGLSNALADRDRSRAIKQLETSLEAGQAPEMILAQIAGQFETFAVLAASRGRSLTSVAAQTGLSEGRLRQASRTLRNFDRNELAAALLELRRVDFGSKQGLLESEDALFALVSTLSSRP